MRCSSASAFVLVGEEESAKEKGCCGWAAGGRFWGRSGRRSPGWLSVCRQLWQCLSEGEDSFAEFSDWAGDMGFSVIATVHTSLYGWVG